jgi:ferredoxin-type protein NapG
MRSQGDKNIKMVAEGSRRDFFIKFGQIGTFALVGGTLWSGFLSNAKSHAFVLRAPGALPEDDFLATCIKCGQCVDACPFQTLSLAKVGERAQIGTPGFSAREIPCYMCEDVPCARACPTGALDRGIDINQSRMGLAVLLDQESCIAFQGLRCEVCYRACPLLDKAITLDYRTQKRTGKHAYFEPIVHSEFCTGCGKCEHVCILEESAIRILPLELAQGKLGENYRLGWKDKSRITRDFKSESDSGTQTSNKEIQQEQRNRVMDSLNDEGTLYE